MPFIRNLLSRGNGKLGEGIHAWSLPVQSIDPPADRLHGGRNRKQQRSSH